MRGGREQGDTVVEEGEAAGVTVGRGEGGGTVGGGKGAVGGGGGAGRGDGGGGRVNGGKVGREKGGRVGQAKGANVKVGGVLESSDLPRF